MLEWVKRRQLHIVWEQADHLQVVQSFITVETEGDVTAGELAFVAALSACSELSLQGYFCSIWHENVSGVGTGPYATIQDGALLVGRTAGGLVVKPTIIGPRAELFEGDGVKVDLTNANIITLVDSMVGVVAAASGDGLSEIRYGRRVQAQREGF